MLNSGFTRGRQKKACRIPENYLFSESALKKLIVPLVIEQLLAVAVGLCDSLMVAYAGEAAVSGVSLIDTVMQLIIALFAALATGGAVVAGQFLGSMRDREGCRTVNQLVLFSAFSGLLITLLMYLGRNWLLDTVFGQIDADVHASADIYLRITAASIPFIALYNAGAAIFRAQGNSKLSMKVSIMMNIINVTGNAILVYGFLMGVAGVAIPTLVSRAFAGIVIFIPLINEKHRLHLLRPFRLRPDFGLLRKILFIGIPNGIENSMFQLGKILLISIISTLGTASIAANAISNTIAGFEIVAGASIGLAMLTVISQCVGAGDYRQVEFYLRRLMKKAYIFVAASAVLICFMLPFILRIYHVSAEASHMALVILLMHSFFASIIWPAAFTFPNMLRAANDVRYCMAVSTISMWTVRIGGAIFAINVLHLGVYGPWIGMMADWFVRAFFFIRRYRSGKWKGRSVIGNPSEELPD